jgi:hypothetical protein
MFDPTVMILNWRRIRVIRHEGHDYHVTPPASVRFNPFRLEVCLYRDPSSRPTWRINRNGRAWFHISNAIYRVCKALRPTP